MLNRLRRKIPRTSLWSVRYSIALISVQALILIGCTTPPPASREVANSTPAPQPVPEGDFFPMRNGSWWAMSQRFSSEGKPDHGEYVPYATASIEAVSVDGDTASASVVSVVRTAVLCPAVVGASCPPYADQTVPVYWIKEKGGNIWQEHQTLPGRHLILRVPSFLGSEVTAPATVSVSGYSEKHISDTTQQATIEPSVSTAMGDFQDCLKLEKTFTVADHFTDPIWKTVSITNSTESTAVWLAKEVGVIKTVYTKTYNDNSKMIVDTSIASYSVQAK